MPKIMPKKKKFYITTPIFYVNDKPHLGHAYCITAADVLARWHRLKGEEVFFLTGTDEHGEKVQEAAKKQGCEPKEFVDALVPKFMKAWRNLNISYDKFIRTTDKEHEEAVCEFIKKVNAAGDIYKGMYEGWYCVPDETFYTELQLENGKCPVCKREVKRVKEESYFFRLSKYQKPILEFYKKNPKFLSPEYRAQEIINRVEAGLHDLSITRTSFAWGVPFPLGKGHATYVWFDALPNYITALGWPNGKNFEKFWPADVHLIGKEINWFHAVIWPAMLMSAGIEPPKKVFAHGWWTMEGEKMSKSRGNVVDPNALADKYGADAVRYFLLREVPFGSDGDFSEAALVCRINSDLADDLGNLLSRTLAMAEQYFGGVVPETKPKEHPKELKMAADILSALDAKMDALDFSGALQLIWTFIRACNKFIAETKPWALEKEGKKKELANAIYGLLESIRIAAIMIAPFMPEKSSEILRQLNAASASNGISAKGAKWGGTKSGTKLCRGEILFKKTELLHDDFEYADLRIGKILEAKEHPDADKLYILKIDAGRGDKAGAKQSGGAGSETRQLVAGIRGHYKKEELAGKKAAFVYNMKPAKIRGVESQGMVLAADDGKSLSLITSEKSEPGESIFAEGLPKRPKAQISFEDFQKLGLFVGNAGCAMYKEKKLRTGHGDLLVEKPVCEGAKIR